MRSEASCTKFLSLDQIVESNIKFITHVCTRTRTRARILRARDRCLRRVGQRAHKKNKGSCAPERLAVVSMSAAPLTRRAPADNKQALDME
jgi:hypothetical protein